MRSMLDDIEAVVRQAMGLSDDIEASVAAKFKPLIWIDV